MKRRFGLAAALLFLAVALPGCVGLDFSPDGGRLIFTWPGPKKKTVLATINTDGSSFHALPDSADGVFPVWSPDGRHIVFAIDKRGDTQTRLYDVAENRTQKVAGDLQPPYVWRQDGRRFAAIHYGKQAPEEVTYDLETNRIAQRVALPCRPENDLKMLWIPSADDLVFRGGEGDLSDLYTIESGAVHRITHTGDVIGYGLCADRKQLLWARKSKTREQPVFSLFAYDLATRTAARIPVKLDLPDRSFVHDSTVPAFDYVAFSPNGRHIAFVATTAATKDRRGRRYIDTCYAVNIDGSGLAALYRTQRWRRGQPPLVLPVWSPDNLHVALLDFEEKRVSLAVQTPTGGKTLLTVAEK